MRLRFWLYALFGAFSILPLAFLGYWVHNTSTKVELEQAARSHLMLAENQAGTIDHYLSTAKKVFETRIQGLSDNSISEDVSRLLAQLDLGKIYLANATTGEIISSTDENGSAKPLPGELQVLDAGMLSFVLANSDPEKTSLTPVTKTSDARNVVYMVRKLDNNVFIGELGTEFFDTLATATRFDKSGYAVIVDNKGQVISHPKTEWQNSHKSLADLDPVKMAISGTNSVSTIFSSITNSNMITGAATVAGVNWAVLIQQPVEEITAHVGLGKKSILIAAILTLALVLLSSILLSYIFASPVEKLITALKATGKEDRFNLIDTTGNRVVPTEYQEMQDTFNDMILRLESNHKVMVKMAFTDPITTLPNRESFRKTVENSLAKLALKSIRGTMVFIDIDNFKEINDTHGHHVGDQVLRCLGSRISGIIEAATGHFPGEICTASMNLDNPDIPKPTLARFGGDEFVMFLPENGDLDNGDEIYEQVLLAIGSPIPGLETNIELSGSIGLSFFPDQGLTYSDLVKRADIAMYHAKKLSKGTIQKFGDGTGEQSEAEIRRDVHHAIINNELELFYQPKISTHDYDVHSVEALVRWNHPVRGLINPGDFIPAIENTDTTSELGEWVVRQACRDMKKFDENGLNLSIAVNIAAHQFVSKDFALRIGRIIEKENCSADRFEIEVTEETALATNQGAADIISQLHEMGFRVSLDDYGRGYSNLTRLSELRVNTLKIDGPLTARLTRDKRTRVIFEATINMAKGLECKTVAEGVESAEEAAILTRLGCSELQGYYFSTPLPANNMMTWLEERRRSPATIMQEKLVSNFS